MIVRCPACHNKYSVHQEAIGNGKLVRCAVCSTMWQQITPDKAIERKKYIGYLIKWTFFWFVVSVSLFSLFYAKDAMIKIWRPVSVFYDALGINPIDQKKPFIIKNVVNFFVQKEGRLYMGIKGEVINISDKVQPLPSFTISLVSDRNNSEKSTRSPYKKIWTHDTIHKKLLPNQKIIFETELQSVPMENLICDISLDTM